MPRNGFSRMATLHGIAAGLVILSWFLMTGIGQAQPPRRLTPPAPIGSPFVPAGPPASRFGPPPMAIGPAPAAVPMAPIPLAYAQPVLAPPGYPPPIAFPAPPYQVRRATPFDPSAPAVVTPYPPVAQPTGPQTLEGPSVAPQVFSLPEPIGNLRLTVSENFLNRLVARDEQKPGEVKDVILGAQVTGRQMTFTKLRFDLLPSNDNIRGALVLHGTVQSQTTGVTPQAMIDTESHQKFLAVKEVYFDGMAFKTRHAVIQVQARNQTVGAQTPLTGTMIGSIADRIAYRIAERRQPEGEAVARDRVAERVYPEFDTTIDNKLATANEQLDGTVRRMLGLVNLMPSQQQVWSSDTYLSYSVQIPTESTDVTSADALSAQIVKDDGASLLIHESLLNGLVSRAGLKGLKTTDKQIKSYFTPFEIKTTTGKVVTDPFGAATTNLPPGLDNVVTDIEFDANDPLTIKIDQDRALVTIRATFKPAGQELVPPLAVTIEYKTDVVGDKIVITPGKVTVVPQKKDDDTVAGGIALKVIGQAVEASLSKLAVDRALPASLWTFGGIVPSVQSIRSQDGWAAISVN